jgi:prepilin-type N-terminal cleavage/methylation domain-containing protein
MARSQFNKMKKKTFQKNKGFTLIELMVSVTIFSIVVFISMGSIFGIFEANRKSRTLKTVMSNLNLALEGMSKEMRYGSAYHCGTSGTVTTPQNCPSGDTFISFLSSDGEQMYYRLNAGALERQIGNEGYTGLTAPEVVIDELTFYVLGAGTDNLLQPKVNITIKGRAGSGNEESKFVLQTLVSQRKRDIP